MKGCSIEQTPSTVPLQNGSPREMLVRIPPLPFCLGNASAQGASSVKLQAQAVYHPLGPHSTLFFPQLETY